MASGNFARWRRPGGRWYRWRELEMQCGKPHHNLPQHYQSIQAPLSWQQTSLGDQWHLGTQADALISLPHVPHHDHHLVCHYPNAKSHVENSNKDIPRRAVAAVSHTNCAIQLTRILTTKKQYSSSALSCWTCMLYICSWHCCTSLKPQNMITNIPGHRSHI